MAFLFVDSLPQNNSRVLQKSIKALEVLLISAGLISTLVMVKGALMPYSCELVFSSLIGFWTSIKCYLSSPLYIGIIINFMVVLIAASSTLHRRETENQEDDDQMIKLNFDDHDLKISESPVVSPPPPAAPPPPPPPSFWPNGTETLFSFQSHMSEADEIKKTTKTLHTEPIEKKVTKINLPPLQTNHLDDKENEEDDTMDATWRSITGEGKQRPKKKQLKKSETWDVPPRNSVNMRRLDSEDVLPSTPKWKELRKSETFNDAVSITCRGGLRRDPSMSLEEFNKQVEAFIKKFNDSMKLQRQESDQRFLDMVKRGL